MASLSCSAATPVSASLLNKSAGSTAFRPLTPSALGLPAIQRRCTVVCNAERKEGNVTVKKAEMPNLAAPFMAAVAALSVSNSQAAFALVDERMTTEGTGLGLGLSNALLGWILAGVFALIWTLYVSTYTSVQEDEDSGLSL